MGERRLSKTVDELFPQEDPSKCRLCSRETVDGRWNYCSERCREIVRAVQRMFTWSYVREQILERDDYTCQSCGESFPNGCDGGLHVDHITRVTDGGHPFDESNLQTLCESCHQQKTAEENSVPDPDPEITLDDYLEKG